MDCLQRLQSEKNFVEMLTIREGVVPRAATALFEKITGSRNRLSASGIRSPSRMSSHGIPTLQSLSKQQNSDKNWQMKATYVEVWQASPSMKCLPNALLDL